MQVQLLEDDHSYEQLLEHRHDIYEYAQLNHLTRSSPLYQSEQTLDRVSHIFCGIKEGEIIASCRLTQVSHVEQEFQDRVKLLVPELDLDATFLISRLCVDTNHQGRMLYKQMLKSICTWSKEHQPKEFFIAKCRVAHATLYRAYGSTIQGGIILYRNQHRKGFRF
jgi:predicted GNAT family N-acyltransferase